jgi:parvulin-like peptidyl-prolyl isomerase
MNRSRQLGDSQISHVQILQQLQNSPLLPQLLQEMATDELIDRLAGEFQLDLAPTAAEFDRMSAQVAQIVTFQGMNAAQIEAITTRTIKIQKFKQAGWGHRVNDYYQTVQHQLVRVQYSILLVEDGLMAQEFFFRIQSGEQAFAEIASQYSQHETAAQGGLVGPMFIKAIHPTISQILLQLQPGGLSPLFQVDRYYGLIRLNELVPPQLDETMTQLLLDELSAPWLQSQLSTPVTGDVLEPEFIRELRIEN